MKSGEQFMMKYEFEERIKGSVTDDEYRLIEVVYNWYPVDLSKDDIAYLYNKYGMTIIRDMLPRSEKMKELHARCNEAKHEIWKLEKLMDSVKRGNDF